jgi:hypothetical protein
MRVVQRTLGAGAVMLMMLVATDAVSAQEPVWSLRFGIGSLHSGGTSANLDTRTTVELANNSLTGNVDVLRQVDCCIELFASGFIPRIRTWIGGGGRLADAGYSEPSSFALGLNYRVHRPAHTTNRIKHYPYLFPFVAIVGDERSDAVRLPDVNGERTAVFRLRATVGFGLGLGWRYRFDKQEQYALDANVRWQHTTLPVGNDERLRWNPRLASIGLVMRLF